MFAAFSANSASIPIKTWVLRSTRSCQRLAIENADARAFNVNGAGIHSKVWRCALNHKAESSTTVRRALGQIQTIQARWQVAFEPNVGESGSRVAEIQTVVPVRVVNIVFTHRYCGSCRPHRRSS